MGLFANKEENEQHKAQILKLFRPQDSMSAAEVSIRLEEVTGGRRVLKDWKVISLLSELVQELKLSSGTLKKTIQGHEVNVTTYFLPLPW